MTRRLWFLLMAAQFAGLAAIFGSDALLAGRGGSSYVTPTRLSGLFAPRDATATFVALPQQDITIQFSVAPCTESCAAHASFSIVVRRHGLAGPEKA